VFPSGGWSSIRATLPVESNGYTALDRSGRGYRWVSAG